MLELLDRPRSTPRLVLTPYGYALTAQFGLDHAQTLAVILPGVMTYMRKEKAAKLIRMGEVRIGITEGLCDEKAQKSIEATEDFFPFHGIKDPSFRLWDQGVRLGCFGGTYRSNGMETWRIWQYKLKSSQRDSFVEVVETQRATSLLAKIN